MADKKEVFISYCTANAELAQYFCSLLEGSGTPCWIAPRDIQSGQDWAENIVKGLNECDLVAFLVSQSSVKSNEVAKEIGLANSFKKEILQVRLEDAPLASAMLYHLSNKQWVDALEGAKNVRFNATLAGIRKLLKKDELPVVSEERNSVLGQARRLVEVLNNSHAEELDALNTPISLEAFGAESVRITFPLRFGATGLDLIFEFIVDNGTSYIDFYANATSDGDSLKEIFWFGYIEKYKIVFSKFFPKSEKIKRGRRWRCIMFMPKTEIPSPFIAPIDTFAIYKSHILMMSKKLFPSLLEWALYAKSVCDSIVVLQEQLKTIFPEEEGWRIGAPEDDRLADCRQYSGINVYKDRWVPTNNNYNGRGWLSIRLEAEEHFISNLNIGIVKYENWHDLGVWQETLLEKSTILLGERVQKSDWWACYQQLDVPWVNSGIPQISFNWKDKLDGFVGHCLEKFSLLKGLVADLETACSEYPTLQDKKPAEVKHDNWWQDHMYIRNRQRLIADSLQNIIGDDSIQVDYHFLGGGNWNKLFLMIREEQFEVCISFQFNHREIKTVIMNLEQPDFETDVVRRFLDRNFHDLVVLLNESRTSNADCNGKSLSEWLDEISDYIHERAEACTTSLRRLKSHMQQVVALTETIQKIFAEELGEQAGWKIDNNARTLLPQKSLDIYHSSWVLQGQPYPPLMIQLLSEAACFDKLYLVLKEFGRPLPDTDRLKGILWGACSVAFGHGSEDCDSLWQFKLAEDFSTTGGSSFEKLLIVDSAKDQFITYLKGFVVKIRDIKPFMDQFCTTKNELMKAELIRSFWDALNQHISEKYKPDEWTINYVNTDEGLLALTKTSWKSLFKIGFGRFDRNTYIGVWCDSSEESVRTAYNEIVVKLKSTDPKMTKDSQWWPGWFYTGKDFSRPDCLAVLAAGKHFEIIEDYLLKLEDLVRSTVPVIENQLGIAKIPALLIDDDKEGAK